MTDDKKREATSLFKKGWLTDGLYSIARKYVVSLVWAEPIINEGIPRILHQGSLFFLRFSDTIFGVTAAHVFRAYEKDNTRYPNAHCQAGNFVLTNDIESRLIDINDDLDLATLRFSEEEIIKMTPTSGEEIIIREENISSWPPPPPETGKGIFLNVPVAELTEVSGANLTAGHYACLVTARTIEADQITCHFDPESHVQLFEGHEFPDTMNFGGASGSPLWALTIQPGGINAWRLAGVIIQHSPSLNLLVARRPDFIRPDGMIRPR